MTYISTCREDRPIRRFRKKLLRDAIASPVLMDGGTCRAAFAVGYHFGRKKPSLHQLDQITQKYLLGAVSDGYGPSITTVY